MGALINYFCLDVCTYIIMFTLLISMLSKKIWSGPAFSMYIAQLCVCLATIIMHLCYTIILLWGPKNNYSLFFAYLFHYLFLIFESYIYPLAAIYVFIAIGIWYSLYKHKALLVAFVLISSLPALLFLSNHVNHWLFYITDDLQLVISSTYRVAYVFITLTMFISVILILSYRNYLNKSSKVVGLIGYPINFIAVCIQSINPEKHFLLLIVVISCYMVATILQRSEVVLSAYAKAHSQFTFYSEVKRYISLDNECNFVFIRIVNSKNILTYIGKQNYSYFLNYFSRLLNKICKENKILGALYYLEDSVFAISTEINSIPELKNCFTKLTELLKKVILVGDFQVYVDARICIASYPQDIYNFEYLKFFSSNFHQIVPKTKDVILVSDFTSNKFYTIKNEIVFIINRALADGNFELFFQPIYSVEKNAYTSAEALLRLNDPYFGFISPTIFIPFAEESKIIYLITDYVFKSVSDFISSNDLEKYKLDCIEINLSTVQCVDPDLVSKIEKYITEYNISPSKIRLEITEKALDENQNIVENNIRILKDKGINFALDNYGTGCTNFKRLINLPLDIIKIDRSYIDEYDKPEVKLIVDDTVKMLKELNKSVLIEGLENREHANIFKSLGCDLLQGYFYSKPLSKDSFIAFLKDHS